MPVLKNKHGLYHVDAEVMHRPACRAISRGKVWEARTLQAIQRNYRGNSLVHAGTFFGDFLPFLSRVVEGQGSVYAFEPNSRSFSMAEKTLELNNIPNEADQPFEKTGIRLARAGLGRHPSTVGKLAVASLKGTALGGSSTFTNRRKASQYEQVPMVGLDAFIDDAVVIDIIQLDVEGYEAQALLGSAEILSRDKPLLILEEGRWTRNKELKDILNGLGYTRHRVVEHNHILRASQD
jgi:FkbM family methyltransferase